MSIYSVSSRLSRIISIRSKNFTLLHVHIDRWITDHLSLIAATIDFANLRCRDDINLWVTLNCDSRLLFRSQGVVFRFCTCGSIHIILKAIDRVISLFSTTIQFIYDDGLTAFLMYVDGNRTIDMSAAVITTVYLTISTIGDINHHIAIHVSAICTAIDSFLIIHALCFNL